MIVRSILKSDAAEFIDLNKRLSVETDFLLMTPSEAQQSVAEQEEKIESMNQGRNRRIFVSELDGKLIGFLGSTIFFPQKMSHTANFVMAVLSEYRNLGVGTSLLASAEQWLRDEHVLRLEMTVMAHNSKAISFYNKNGFSKEGIRKRAIKMNGSFYDEYYMAKFLS